MIMKIKARDLRVGDEVINWARVKSILMGSHVMEIRWDDGTGNVWSNDRELTIDRHEPVVTERWVNVYRNNAYLHETRELADVNVISNRTGLIKITFHDDKPVAVELVEV